MRGQYKILTEAYNKVLETSKLNVKEDNSREWYNNTRKQLDNHGGLGGFPFFKTIKDWPFQDEFIKFLCKHIYDVSLDNSEITLYGIDEFINVAFGYDVDRIAWQAQKAGYENWCDQKLNEITIAKLAVKQLKKYYNQFKNYKKAQAVLKKGSEETGIDIDI
jgi:hypothetical protein